MSEPEPGPEASSSEEDSSAVRVAVGVLARTTATRPEVLIARRPADAVLGGLWEFPGGKLEPGESAEAALVREMEEELGVAVVVVGRLTEVQHRYDHGAVWLEVFGCRLSEAEGATSEPEALASDAVRWVDAAGLAAAEFPAANGPIVAAATGWMAAGLGVLRNGTGD